MAEHSEGSPTATRSRLPRALPGRALRRQVLNGLATVISVVTTIVVAVLAVHIVFVVFEANTSNDIVSTAKDWADDLAWQFKDVFQPRNPKAEVAVNYGLAGLVYLIVGRVVTGLVRRFA